MFIFAKSYEDNLICKKKEKEKEINKIEKILQQRHSVKRAMKNVCFEFQ